MRGGSSENLSSSEKFKKTKEKQQETFKYYAPPFGKVKNKRRKTTTKKDPKTIDQFYELFLKLENKMHNILNYYIRNKSDDCKLKIQTIASRIVNLITTYRKYLHEKINELNEKINELNEKNTSKTDDQYKKLKERIQEYYKDKKYYSNKDKYYLDKEDKFNEYMNLENLLKKEKDIPLPSSSYIDEEKQKWI